MRVFALSGSETVGKSAVLALGRKLDSHEERDFEDGEHKARTLVSVRGEDVYVIHSLDGSPGASVNDKLCKLLFFIATCQENGARTVTAVCPYLAYGRKDRQTKSRDPVTTRYVAQLFEAVGTDRIVVMEAHSFVAFQNAFRCTSVHLDTRKLFVSRIAAIAGDLPVTILSPDGGGVKRAQLLKESYESHGGHESGFGFVEKRRSRGVVSGDLFAGDVGGTAVFIYDDMISTGGTMLRAAQACRERGATSVYGIAAHGLFGPGIETLLESPMLDGVLVTDSVAAAAKTADRCKPGRIEIVPCGELLGAAIRCLEDNIPISDLLGIGT